MIMLYHNRVVPCLFSSWVMPNDRTSFPSLGHVGQFPDFPHSWQTYAKMLPWICWPTRCWPQLVFYPTVPNSFFVMPKLKQIHTMKHGRESQDQSVETDIYKVSGLLGQLEMSDSKSIQPIRCCFPSHKIAGFFENPLWTVQHHIMLYSFHPIPANL